MTVSYPNKYQNYCTFDNTRIQRIVSKREAALNDIETSLKMPHSEDEVVENLYALNLMLDEGLDKEKVNKLYPVLSKYNSTKSPNIQTFLAGIYRKTLIPDAFGPLVKMLIQNSQNASNESFFDSNEEIGGAILNYLA